jgi:hypothetical protein
MVERGVVVRGVDMRGMWVIVNICRISNDKE